MGYEKQRLLRYEQYLGERRKAMEKKDTFDMFQQVEEAYHEEFIVVDATTDGTDQEFRVIRTDGMFYLELWDSSMRERKVVESLTRYEIVQKLVRT